MGGHGALTVALRNPEDFRSLSAFAPVCAPSRCPWGEKAFRGYLGEDRQAWLEHDATELIGREPFDGPILIDQGMADPFLGKQLHPDAFEAAGKKARQTLTLRRHEGYDHGYFFISTAEASCLPVSMGDGAPASRWTGMDTAGKTRNDPRRGI
jgi:S-formylglutathione hydrolase